MPRWRILTALALLLVAGLPLLLPFLELIATPQALRVWDEGPRLALLAGNTLSLVALTLLLAFPPGVVLAVLLYRTDLPGASVFRRVILAGVFVPLPLFAAGWEGVGVLRGQGMLSAAWVHAMAGLPWVTLLVGLGLRSVERDLEEDALTAAGPWRVLWHVTLPRARAALAAAAIWVAVQAATEIVVTDLWQIRTFAEEVYGQMTRPDGSNAERDASLLVARALAVAFPSILVTGLAVFLAVRAWQRSLPPGETSSPPLHFSTGKLRWPFVAVVVAFLILLVGVPIAGLVWRAGLSGGPPEWSAGTLLHQIGDVLRVGSVNLAVSLLTAGVVGMLTAGFAWLLCWLSLESRWFRGLVLVIVVLAWALPGPVVGLGLKSAIELILDVTGSRMLAKALWYDSSVLPIVWAQFVRLLPFAVALLWHVVRRTPPELRESVRVDGATPLQEFRHAIAPLTARAAAGAALAVVALSLGELGASKTVSTPGIPSFAEEVFRQLHFGPSNDLAARCLLLLIFVFLAVGLFSLVTRRTHANGAARS